MDLNYSLFYQAGVELAHASMLLGFKTNVGHAKFIPGMPFWPSLSSVTLMLYITVIFTTNDEKLTFWQLLTDKHHDTSRLITQCQFLTRNNRQQGGESQCSNLWVPRHH